MFTVDHERFAKLTASVQNIVVTIALVIGGIWTVYSFQAVKSAEKASLEAEALRLKRPVVTIDIDSKSVSGYVSDFSSGHEVLRSKNFLLSDVSLKNVGNESVYVDMTVPRLVVARLSMPRGSSYPLYSVPGIASIPNDSWNNTAVITLLPGASHHLHYVTEIDLPGFYNVGFSVPATHAANTGYGSQTHNSGQVSNEPRWSASRIVNVQTFPKPLPNLSLQGVLRNKAR